VALCLIAIWKGIGLSCRIGALKKKLSSAFAYSLLVLGRMEMIEYLEVKGKFVLCV
jgi:hypothetical protein